MIVCLPIVLRMAGLGIEIGTKEETEDGSTRGHRKRGRGLFYVFNP
jgi:hypothetical protein